MIPNHDGVGDAREFDVNPTTKSYIRYDTEEDCIYAIGVDHEATEYIVGPHLTRLEEFTTERVGGPNIGLIIRNARKFCQTRGLVSRGKTTVSGILKFMSIFAGTSHAAPTIKNDLLPLLKKYEIDEFEFPAE